jgi:hypothetical protein
LIPKQLTQPFLILCEGTADRAFLKYLLSVREINHAFEICYPEGKYGFGNSAFGAVLSGLALVRGFEENVKAILIVTDCDDDPAKSFSNIQEQIQDAGYNVPQTPFQIIQTPNLPMLVVVMIPFDNVCGNLESYIVRAMSEIWGDVKISADRHINDTPASAWRDCKRAKSIMQSMITVLHEQDPNKSLAYIWSENAEFCEMLKHEVFNGLSDYLENFPNEINNMEG